MDKPVKKRTLSEIQKKIERGEVVVATVDEICNRVRNGESIEVKDVDVVTAATCGVMSGTYAVLSFKVAEPDTFVKAENVWLNGVPAQVGPCPNERIGILDLVVLGTTKSKSDPGYGGGHLFRDLVEGKEVRVEIETSGGETLITTTTIKKIPLAMLYASRNAFKNYLAFVNPGKSAIDSIFHTEEFTGNLEELTFCGCGELNPLENDPDLKTIGIGSRVMINGAQGFVSGPGTRSSKEKPNLAGFADMHGMDPEYMGGFRTSHGPDNITTWAVAIPVLDREILNNITKTDEDIGLKVVDVRNRIPIFEATYGDVWKGKEHAVVFHESKCEKCELCMIVPACPVNAVMSESGKVAVHDHSLCFNCGICVSKCKGHAFAAELGVVTSPATNKEIPVVLRQSNRVGAVKAAQELKEKIINGKFIMNEPTEQIQFNDYS